MKKISLKTKNYIGTVACGLFWLLAGIFELSDSRVFKIAEGIALIFAWIMLILRIFLQAEDGDEMSRAHFLKAKAMAFDSILSGVLLFTLVNSVTQLIWQKDVISDWHAWLMMFIGVMMIISGMNFARYERDGDDA